MRSTVTLLNNLAFVAFTSGIPLLYAIRTGRFSRTMLLGWLLFFLWFVVQTFVAIPIAHHYDRSLEDLFSDGPTVIAAVFVGPIWGGIIGGIALLFRWLLAKLAPSVFRTLCKPTC